MKRREFLTLVAGAAACPLPSVRPARAQTPPSNQPAARQVGQVATLQGNATVARANLTAAIALQVPDLVFRNDTLATGVNSSLGVTFDDETTLSLSASSRVVVNEFVYQQAGNADTASFDVAVGTVAFVASLVAKTGDMKITTPVATLGIRGTTGVIDIPAGGDSGAGEPRIKLYADGDGHVGRIEVFDPQGVRLGGLTQGASAFALRPGPGGRMQAVPFQIPPQEAARDREVLQRLFNSHAIGRQITIERRRSRGPNPQRPNNPRQPNNERPPGRGKQPDKRNPRPQAPPRKPKPGER